MQELSQMPLFDESSRRNDFLNCKAVFQGGGCKAFAYIGAYEQARYMRINFSAFAGTSAGSIIAALAAAGATPGQMIDFVMNVDFSVLSSKLEILKNLPKAFNAKGLISSAPIEKIVNKMLCEVLGKPDNYTVRFKDLRYPLSVVATDLLKHDIKIWSSKTPEESVALAVRCSCSIPFYFKPVFGKYVDGFLLSNLPSIVFSEDSYDFDRILAFSVKSVSSEKENVKPEWIDYYRSVVHGATNLQLKMMGVSSVVTIPTTLSEFDFGKFKGDGKLPKEFDDDRKAGQEAFRNFMNQKSDSGSNLLSSNFTFTNKEQLRSQVLLYSDQRFYKHTHIYVSAPNLEFAQRMFLLVLRWIRDGVKVVVYVESVKMESVKSSLLDLGVELRISAEKLPVYGYFFHNEIEDKWIAITADMHLEKSKYNEKKFVKVDSARCFNAKEDKYIIESMVNLLNRLPLEPSVLKLSETLQIQECSEEEILQIFKNDKAFENCKVEYADLPIDNLLFQKSFIIGYSYRCMAAHYGNDFNSPIDKPAVISMNGHSSYMAPITVLEEKGKYIVVKGHVRLAYAYQHLKKVTIRVAVIHDYSEKKEVRTYPISKVEFSDHTTMGTKEAREIFLKNAVEDAFAANYLDNII